MAEANRRKIDRLCDVARTFSKADTKDCRQLAEATKSLLWEKVEAQLDRNKRQSVLCQYMSDGWACRVRESLHESLDGAKVRRAGRLRLEFLLERAFFVSDGPRDTYEKTFSCQTRVP